MSMEEAWKVWELIKKIDDVDVIITEHGAFEVKRLSGKNNKDHECWD